MIPAPGGLLPGRDPGRYFFWLNMAYIALNGLLGWGQFGRRDFLWTTKYTEDANSRRGLRGLETPGHGDSGWRGGEAFGTAECAPHRGYAAARARCRRRNEAAGSVLRVRGERSGLLPSRSLPSFVPHEGRGIGRRAVASGRAPALGRIRLHPQPRARLTPMRGAGSAARLSRMDLGPCGDFRTDTGNHLSFRWLCLLYCTILRVSRKRGRGTRGVGAAVGERYQRFGRAVPVFRDGDGPE